MIISDDRRIQSIQAEFQTHFPNLKIEFYAYPHDAEQGSVLTQQLLDINKTIGELREQQKLKNLVFGGYTGRGVPSGMSLPFFKIAQHYVFSRRR